MKLQQKLESFVSEIYAEPSKLLRLTSEQFNQLTPQWQRYILAFHEDLKDFGVQNVSKDTYLFSLPSFVVGAISAAQQLIVFMDKKTDKEAMAYIVAFQMEELVYLLNILFNALYKEELPEVIQKEFEKSLIVSTFLSFDVNRVNNYVKERHILDFYIRRTPLKGVAETYDRQAMQFKSRIEQVCPEELQIDVNILVNKFKKFNNETFLDYKASTEVMLEVLKTQLIALVAITMCLTAIDLRLGASFGMIFAMAFSVVMKFFSDGYPRKLKKDQRELFLKNVYFYNKLMGQRYADSEISNQSAVVRLQLSLAFCHAALNKRHFVEYKLNDLEKKVTKYSAETAISLPILNIQNSEVIKHNENAYVANFIFACKQEKRGKIIKTKRKRANVDENNNNNNATNADQTVNVASNDNNLTKQKQKAPMDYSNLELNDKQKTSGVLVWDDSGSKAFFTYGKDIEVRKFVDTTFESYVGKDKTNVIPNGFGKTKGQFGIFKYMSSCDLYSLKRYDGIRVIYERDPSNIDIKDLKSAKKPKSVPVWRPIGWYKK